MKYRPSNEALSIVNIDIKSTSGRANMPPTSEFQDYETRMSTQEVVIEYGRSDRYYWRDLWRYRELFRVLAWRDISVRYKQTVIGAAWALIRPFMTMIVFTIIFGRIARLPSQGAPYALLVFAGMFPWTFFSTALA